jgi:prepilin-type N-terminal cleavage/methylation domain-containing protein
MKFYTLEKDKGFTLIELLVVVSIIGLLSTIVLASLATARAKSRDAQRRALARQFQTALELYRLDNGTYPISGGGGVVTCNTPGTAWNASAETPCWNYLFTNGSKPLSSYMPIFYDPLQTTITGAGNSPNGAGQYGFDYFSTTWGSPEFCVGGQFYVFIYRTELPAASTPTDNYCNGTSLVASGPYTVVVKSPK